MGRQLKLAQVESEILQYSSSANFPQPTGSIKYLYLDQAASTLYRWNDITSQYVLLNSPTTPSTSGSAEGEVYFADLVTSGRIAPCIYNNGVSGSGATLTSTGSIALGQVNQPGRIDNVIPLIDDIILVRNESLEYTNGLYSITSLGSPTSSFVLTRVSYYDTGSEIYPSQIIGLRGLNGANQTYIQQTPNPTVGSSSIKFTQSPSTSTQTLPILFIDTVTTGPLPAYTYATGSSYVGFPGFGATLTATVTGSLGVIGGITASSNVRILAVSESNNVYNGTYTVTAPGTSKVGSVNGTPWKLTRIDYWASIQPNYKEFVVSRFGATEYGSRYVLQSSSITPANIGISQALIFQKYLYQSSGSGGSSTPAFPFTGSALITGSLTVTGSIVATTGFTGSLFGTASFAQTASYVLNAVSSSYAATASQAPLYLPLTGGTISGNVSVLGTASIAFLTVTYESASVIYSSGSNQFGDATNDTQTLIGRTIVSGSLEVTGSANLPSITGSLFGTASFATSASYAPNTTFPYTGSAIVTGSIILTGSLQVAVPSTAGAASELARFKPTDNTGFLQIINYSTTQGAFTPTIRTLLSASSTNVGLQLIAQIGNDGATNANPAMTFNVMSQSSAAGQIRNRTLFTWENNNTSSMALTTVGLAIGSNLLKASASLHINNTSSFNSFLVEDDTTPDSSPFVIDNVGRVGIGKTIPSDSLDISGSVLVTGSISILAFTSSAANIFTIRNSTNTQNLMSLSGDGRIVIGLGAQILGNTSVANRNIVIGNGACDITSAGVSENVVSIGYNATSSNSGTAIGANTVVASRQGTAVGQGAYAGEDSIALGYGARADGSALYTSLAIGRGARASATLSGIIAVGQSSYTNALQQTLAFCVDPVGANSQTMLLTKNANLVFRNSTQLTSGTHWDTTATNTITIHTGSIPASNISSSFQLYTSASVVGNASPHFRTEAGNIVKLYTQAAVTSSQGIADALTNLGLLTGSSVIATTAGPFGISNSSGSYTYYNTLSSSMAAASAGANKTVEVFADITESADVTITIPNGVTINGNGHTYTFTNATTNTLFQTATGGTCNIFYYNITSINGSTTGKNIYTTTGTIDLMGSVITRTDSTNNAGNGSYAVQLNGTGTIKNGTIICNGYVGGYINQGGTLINPTANTVNSVAIYNVSGNTYNALGITSGVGIGIQGNNIYKATGMASGNARGASLIGNCHDVLGFSQSNVGAYIGTGSYSNITGISNGSFGVQNQDDDCIVNNLRAISSANNGFFTQTKARIIINGGIIESSAAIVTSCASQVSFNNVYIKSTWNSVNGHGLQALNVDNIQLVDCTVEVANSSANCLHATTSRSVKYISNKWKTATIPVNPNIVQGMINTQDNQGNIII